MFLADDIITMKESVILFSTALSRMGAVYAR